MTPRKWYFCVNADGFARMYPLVAVAVASARANTSLRPVCLYNGDDPEHGRTLAKLGVEVVPHRSSLEAELRVAYGPKYDTYSGHWLRIDLPQLEREEDVVLYTDVDVMFLRQPSIEATPALLAAAPEFEIADTSHFNSGVMVMNLPQLREVHDAFIAAIRRRLLHRFTYPAHDQESFNRFFGASLLNRVRGRAYTPLSPLLNWKPYWGVNDEASIIHFHGPKPRMVHKLVAMDGELPTGPIYKALWRRDPDAYAAYVALWDGYWASIRGPAPRRRRSPGTRKARRAGGKPDLHEEGRPR